jgi:hypothetical protein
MGVMILRIRALVLVPMASALIVLGASASAGVPASSPGWEDLVSCRLDSQTAADAWGSYQAGLRSRSLKKADPELSREFSDWHFLKYFYRPEDERSIFGARLRGILLGGMHGSIWAYALGEGDMGDVKSKMENHRGLILQIQSKSATIKHPSKATYVSSIKFFENGISTAPIIIKKKIEARSVLLGSETGLMASQSVKSLFVVGCSFNFDDGYRDQRAVRRPHE